MIFRQGEAIYYTQKRISDGSVWREGELGKVDKIPFLETLTNGHPLGPGHALCLCPLHAQVQVTVLSWNSPGFLQGFLPGSLGPQTQLCDLDPSEADSVRDSLGSGLDSLKAPWQPGC